MSDSIAWSHSPAASTSAVFVSMQCTCGVPHAVELPEDGVASVDCDCGRALSLRYGNPEPPVAAAVEPCPRCSHQEHDHNVVGVFAWCWKCGQPCGSLRGHPKDSSWEVLRGLIQNDVNAGIKATRRRFHGVSDRSEQ